MYAIVEMKGQQFKVEAGKKLFINRMNELEKGATVEFENVLLLDNEGKVKVGAPYVKGAKVVCEVLDNECRGDKVLVFHKKRRKGYRKLNGHRQDLTLKERTTSMAHKKGVGSSKNGRESESKRLGVKIFGGQFAKAGNIIVRQRGTVHNPGENMGIGSDHTLFALCDGIVTFRKKRDNKSYVSIQPVA